MSSMGERLAWARNQQGLVLQQVSERAGLAIGYISQLEKGAKVNPTIEALNKIAQALGVTVPFLLGEVKFPYEDTSEFLMAGQALVVYRKFIQHYEELTHAQRQRLAFESMDSRFAYVVDFVCRTFPGIFTRVVIAFQLGISVQSLYEIIQGSSEPSGSVLENLTRITGIPLRFFAVGELKDEERTQRDHSMRPAKPVDMVSVGEAARYAMPIALAIRLDLTPEQVAHAIEAFVERKQAQTPTSSE